MTWRRLWQASWFGFVLIASLVFPHDRLIAFVLLVIASGSFNDMLRGQP
jgi:hypothetical protein